MLNLYDENRTKDADVVFYDGMIWIITLNKTNGRSIPEKGIVERIILHPEYDTPVSLKDISEKYPEATMLIFESALDGEVYMKDNHRIGEWELIGKTLGYA